MTRVNASFSERCARIHMLRRSGTLLKRAAILGSGGWAFTDKIMKRASGDLHAPDT